MIVDEGKIYKPTYIEAAAKTYVSRVLDISSADAATTLFGDAPVVPNLDLKNMSLQLVIRAGGESNRKKFAKEKPHTILIIFKNTLCNGRKSPFIIVKK